MQCRWGRGGNRRSRGRGNELGDYEVVCLGGMSSEAQKRVADEMYLRDGLDGACHCENTLMYTGDDLADASLYAGLIPQISNVFSCLADDDAGVLGADERA